MLRALRRDVLLGGVKVRPEWGNEGPHAARRRLPPPDPATRPAQGLSAGEELRLPASEQERVDRAAASGAQNRATTADAGQTPAGVCVPLLRQADADPAAARSGDGGQAI